MLISCLCVTHERPEWMPWLLHQFGKQLGRFETELLIVDSSKDPVLMPGHPGARVLHRPEFSGISVKRNIALQAACGNCVAWFDDDDWQHPERLRATSQMIGFKSMMVAGSIWSTRYDVRTGKTAPYFSLSEPVIFNSALYDAKLAKSVRFDERLQTGEDTRWNLRLLEQRPSYSVLGGDELHAWMVHGKNVSAVHRNVPFDLPSSIPFDAWEREFLEKMRNG